MLISVIRWCGSTIVVLILRTKLSSCKCGVHRSIYAQTQPEPLRRAIFLLHICISQIKSQHRFLLSSILSLSTEGEDLRDQESVSRVLTELLDNQEGLFDSDDDDVSTTNDYSSINEQVLSMSCITWCHPYNAFAATCISGKIMCHFLIFLNLLICWSPSVNGEDVMNFI